MSSSYDCVASELWPQTVPPKEGSYANILGSLNDSNHKASGETESTSELQVRKGQTYERNGASIAKKMRTVDVAKGRCPPINIDPSKFDEMDSASDLEISDPNKDPYTQTQSLPNVHKQRKDEVPKDQLRKRAKRYNEWRSHSEPENETPPDQAPQAESQPVALATPTQSDDIAWAHNCIMLVLYLLVPVTTMILLLYHFIFGDCNPLQKYTEDDQLKAVFYFKPYQRILLAMIMWVIGRIQTVVVCTTSHYGLDIDRYYPSWIPLKPDHTSTLNIDKNVYRFNKVATWVAFGVWVWYGGWNQSLFGELFLDGFTFCIIDVCVDINVPDMGNLKHKFDERQAKIFYTLHQVDAITVLICDFFKPWLVFQECNETKKAYLIAVAILRLRWLLGVRSRPKYTSNWSRTLVCLTDAFIICFKRPNTINTKVNFIRMFFPGYIGMFNFIWLRLHTCLEDLLPGVYYF